MRQPLLLLTIDVEEDMPGWQITEPLRVDNVRALPGLAETCRELGVRPTYLCTYPVVTEEASTAVVRGLMEAGDCEIGTHLHPWNTPPFRGVPGREGDERQVAYYMSELGAEGFRAKLEVLHARLAELCGKPPTSFRAGRFGIDGATLAELVPLGYRMDTSVTPLADHGRDGGPDFRAAPQLPYRPSRTNALLPGDLPLVEIPVSIALTRNLPQALQRAFVRLPSFTRLRGLLSRDYLNVVDYGWLYPARFPLEVMCRTAETLIAMGSPVLNVFLHSSELAPAASGRSGSAAEAEECHASLRGILAFCIERLGARPVTATEAADELAPAFGLAQAAAPAPAG